MTESKRLSCKITFTKAQTDALKKICAKPDFLSQISVVILNQIYWDAFRETIDERNQALKKIKGYAKKILSEKKYLFGIDLYGVKDIDFNKFEKHISSLEPVKKISRTENALFAIAYILRKNGYSINLNPTKNEIGEFLTTAEIVFNVAGINATRESIEKAARRAGIESGNGQVPFHPSMLPLSPLGWNAECSYATSNGCFSATYTYSAI
ncbi:MAG: hypothetical protein AB2672_20515 [Candidatus Thiodiazotropha endolucinida]|nr:MAG: hypothetical protein DBP02_16640 [gamma proteobacterium symbiont of Ctena orbiculata]